MRNLIKDIHIDNNGIVTFELLDGNIHEVTINIYNRADFENIQKELILNNLNVDYTLKLSERNGTIAFYENNDVFLKNNNSWYQIYDEVNEIENFTLEKWSADKAYEPNNPFHFDGKKYFSKILGNISMPPLINFNFIDSSDVLEAGMVKTITTDREFIHYTTPISYIVYDNLNKRMNVSPNRLNGVKISNEIFTRLKDGILYYDNSPTIENVLLFCKYGNFIYTVDNNRTISKRRIGRLMVVMDTHVIPNDIPIDENTLFSFGSESFGFYNKSINSFSILHGNEVHSVVVSELLDYLSMADRGNVVFYNKDVKKICSLQVFAEAIPFNSDFILNSDADPTDVIMTVDLKESYSSKIVGYGKPYGIDIKDITLNDAGILFVLDMDGRIHRIIPSTGSIFSTQNSIISSNNIIEGSQSIGIINKKLYITMITDLRIIQIDMETLEPNGVVFSMNTGDSYIQSIAQGLSGDIAVLTDAGSLFIYENLTSEPTTSTQLINYTNATKVIPSDSRSFFASNTRSANNSIFKIFYGNQFEQSIANPNGNYKQFLCLAGSGICISIDKSEDQNMHVYEATTDLSNI